jgi:histone deacetylase 1/2
VVQGRDIPMPPRDLYAHLLQTEQRIESRRSAEIHGGFSSANAVTRGGSRPPYRGGGGSSGGKAILPSPPQQQTNNNNKLSGGSSSSTDSSSCPTCGRPNGRRTTCQLCRFQGHVASRCHKRFKRDFLGIGNDGRNNERQAAMATHGPIGVPQGHTPSYPIDASWYMDTAATDHLTNELDKLHSREPYHGPDKVHTANGSGMRIEHIGQTSLSTSTSRQLQLHDVLHVPTVTRNLLSVPKLTHDNDIFVEFHPFDVIVKDRTTRGVLLEGRYKHGL